MICLSVPRTQSSSHDSASRVYHSGIVIRSAIDIEAISYLLEAVSPTVGGTVPTEVESVTSTAHMGLIIWRAVADIYMVPVRHSDVKTHPATSIHRGAGRRREEVCRRRTLHSFGAAARGPERVVESKRPA